MKRALLLLPLLSAFAACGSAPEAPVAAAITCDLDPGLTKQECATLHAMALPAALPPARGNAKGDDTDAATLGFAVFFDARFSKGESVRCATCHTPEKRFADGKPTAIGLARGTRHSPTLLNAARMHWPFWDGRADSLWSQPLLAFENPLEMDFTRLELAHAIALRHAADYEKVFGPLPPLDDVTRFPARGRPGDPAWEAMTQGDRDAVNLVAANVGKALEAYERRLAAGPSAFDRFLAGDAGALDVEERAGLVVFVKNRCADCHGGPSLSDQKFHALRVAAWPGDPIDVGREGAYAALAASPFTARGAFWDGPRDDVPTTPAGDGADRGAFRTPSLRNLTKAGPWGHNGRFATLDDAITFHGPVPTDDPSAAGVRDPLLNPVALSELDRGRLVRFLQALDGSYPLPPWNDWPQR
jgi:cytochrome c peroxidase